MIHPTLKALAVPFEAFGGAVTFTMLPFKNVQAAQLEDAFALLYPRYRYRDTRTGTVTTERPAEFDALADMAKRQGVEFEDLPRNPFTVEDAWDTSQRNFVLLEGRTVAVEFRMDESSPPEARLFEAYWQETRAADLQGRWELYRQMVAITVTNAWVEALNAATESYRAFAPPPATKGGQASTGSPLSGDKPATGSATPTTTGTSSGRRAKRSPKAATRSASR